MWTGELEVLLVIGIGLASALIGANLAYWLGRKLGRTAVKRYADRLSITPDHLDTAVRLVGRYGPFGVFASRFVPGVRFLANAVAGVTRLRPLFFSVASDCAALAYLPLVVGAGYLAGLRFGDELEGFQLGLPLIHALVQLVVAISVGAVWVSLGLLQSRRWVGPGRCPPRRLGARGGDMRGDPSVPCETGCPGTLGCRNEEGADER